MNTTTLSSTTYRGDDENVVTLKIPPPLLTSATTVVDEQSTYLTPSSAVSAYYQQRQQQQQQQQHVIQDQQHQQSSTLVKLNVGGKLFVTHRETLVSSKIYTLKHHSYNQQNNNNIGNSSGNGMDDTSSNTSSFRDSISDVSESCFDNDESGNFFTKLLDDSSTNFMLKDDQDAYFIDRSSTLFEIILEFIRTGDLVLPITQQKEFNHVLQTVYVQKLLKEADFYMIDLSSQLYNIVGDGIYVSEETKGFKKCMFFFDKDPTFSPCSVFINGMFHSKLWCDREVRICNGTLLVYDPMNHNVEYILYPTAASSNGQLTMRTSSVHSQIVSPTVPLTTVIVVKDTRKFNSTFILREAVPPSKIALNFNKPYFNLSDYNHSIRVLQIDSSSLQIIEVFKDDAPVPPTLHNSSNSGPTSRPTNIRTPEEIFREKYTFARMRPLHGLIEDEGEEEDSSDLQSVATNSGSFLVGSATTPTVGTKDNVLSKTRMKVIRTNFIAKSKKNFIYIESRNRLYWNRAGKVLIFELSNKNL